jgi:hypothetical protein
VSPLGSSRPEPEYVERGGEIAYRLPFRSSGARIHFLLVQGDEECLRRHLDRGFNRPSGGTVSLRPAGPWVLLNFIMVKRLTSGEPDRALGGVGEMEASIWVPAFHAGKGDRLVWTVPYMFVDSGQALASGREVYGYPKQLGSIEIHELGDGTPDKLRLRTLALKKHARDELAREHRVLKVRRVGPHHPGRRATHPDLGRVANRLRAMSPEPGEVVRFVEQVLDADGAASPGSRPRPAAAAVQDRADLAEVVLRLYGDLFDCRLTMLLLKQFRSATDPQRACYQAILEVPHRVAEFEDWTLHGDAFDVTFDALASQHMQEELGVSSGTQRAAMAVSLDFDFEVLPARVLWQASVD